VKEVEQLEFGNGWKMPETVYAPLRRYNRRAVSKAERNSPLSSATKVEDSDRHHTLDHRVGIRFGFAIPLGVLIFICFGVLVRNQIQALIDWQFFWGFFGGCILVGYRLYAYAIKLTDDTPWPRCTFKSFLLLGWWGFFLIVSGFVSVVCEPHSPLMAVFEGVSTPALFLLVAKDFRV